MKPHWSIWAALAGALASFSLAAFLLASQGFIGWLKYEKLSILALSIVLVMGLASLVFLILAATGCKVKKATAVIGSFTAIFSLSLMVAFSAMGNLNVPSNLHIYASSDGQLSETNSLHIAVASDSHWGASSSNPEARTEIMKTIASGDYDLMIHGGDIVDLGFVKSYYDEAISDMETYLPNQKMHFIMGNHDALVNGVGNYSRIFAPKEASLNRVLNLSPNVHWVIFNMIWDDCELSNDTVSWLKETLASFPEEDCVVVESHGFVYATGTDAPAGRGRWSDIPELIDLLAPIYQENHVDLVMSGHVHSMEYMEANGVRYALVGPFGGSLFPDQEYKTAADSKFFNGTEWGYVDVQIEESKNVTLTYKGQSGQNLYSTSFAY